MIAALALLSGEAFALTYDVTFCFAYDVDFEDLGGDYWTSNSTHRTANGIEVMADAISGCAVDTVKYATDPGGCATFALDSACDYAIAAFSEAEVNDVTVEVFDDDVNPGLFGYFPYPYAAPYEPYADDVTEPVVVIPWDTWVAQLAVASRIFGMNNLGLGGDTFTMYDNDCCYATLDIWSESESKTIIGHEVGHAIGRHRDEGAPNFDYGAWEAYCDGGTNGVTTPFNSHSAVSLEYQSAAALEGFADLISAWTWNDLGASDCTYDRHYGSWFDLDPIGGVDNADGVTNCENKVAGTVYDDGRDWLDSLDVAADPNGCNSTLDHRSTQYDWLRYGWDMIQGQSVPIDDFVDLYDNANPHTWDPDTNATTSLGSTLTTDDPIVRWEAAADSHPAGYGAEHDVAKDNGQEH